VLHPAATVGPDFFLASPPAQPHIRLLPRAERAPRRVWVPHCPGWHLFPSTALQELQRQHTLHTQPLQVMTPRLPKGGVGPRLRESFPLGRDSSAVCGPTRVPKRAQSQLSDKGGHWEGMGVEGESIQKRTTNGWRHGRIQQHGRAVQGGLGPPLDGKQQVLLRE